MADTYTVFPTVVQKNGVNIVGYVGHKVIHEYTVEGSAPVIAATSLIVAVIDAPSNTARANATALASSFENAQLAKEYGIRQTVRYVRPLAGDTVVFTNLGSVISGGVQNTADGNGGVLPL